MTPGEFIKKWKRVQLKERSSSQPHFIDLCKVLEVDNPVEADPDGEWYCFEKGLKKDSGEQGFADVWKKGHFGWEYKGKRKDLADAFVQLSRYREALEDPPLLIVCDTDRFEIHTNFNNTVKEVHAFDLDGLADPANLRKLHQAFTDPEALRPGKTQKKLTEEVAASLTNLSREFAHRKVDPHTAAHFIMKCIFCMFAEDVDLLPKHLFLTTLQKNKFKPEKLSKSLKSLFEAMAKENGQYGEHEIAWFNGNLFDDAVVIDLEPKEVRLLEDAAEQDWSGVDPSIFGTLFERLLDPDKRSQTGAHYTSREDIETLLKPVMLDYLRREWDTVRVEAEAIYVKAAAAKKPPGKKFETLIEGFLHRLRDVTVLDPACGSGNFLYVALRMLLTLEKEVLIYAAARDLQHRIPMVKPTQLRGIEINQYASELAQIVIWIGLLQWQRENGYPRKDEPILETMRTIENRDAILDLSDPANPKEPTWPDAEFIVGNPPFLGGKLLRSNLDDAYIDRLFLVYDSRVKPESDLCCYWFDKSRNKIKAGKAKRAGLLATQSIRGGASRDVLRGIVKHGGIYFALGNKEWVLDGANVGVSMIGFDNGKETIKMLDGQHVEMIHENLSAGTRTVSALKLAQNLNVTFMGDTKGGKFDIDDSLAFSMLLQPNPNGAACSDVIFPRCNGMDVTGRSRNGWIIDFGTEMAEHAAALYESPFQYIKKHVYPERLNNKRDSYRTKWWIHVEPRPALRASLCLLDRFLVTTIHAKHRLFSWMRSPTIPDHALFIFAKQDDLTLGLLHSRIHGLWGLHLGTYLEDRPRYTPTTCFETFPFPRPTKPQEKAIAAAAKELDTLRNNWLNPPEWTRTETLEFPGSVDGPWKRYVHTPDKHGIGTVKYPRLVAKGPGEAEMLRKRTLTNLYNERPAWLANAHRTLDEAVFAAYGWSPDLTDDDLLAKLLALNLERAAEERAAAGKD